MSVGFTSDPDRVFSLWGSNDLDFHGGGSKGGDFLLHTVSNTGVHGGTAREDVVSVEILWNTILAILLSLI